ncbi:FSR family fosmidomycin resistance protein-like MFS transporter [Paenibacillus cellulosilyticus]|uniref:FSR family fosmidomycin resistance protein-like MFS transporter n=1 Tax=Paenibacillus cellulosilyticus TaxID=375489 RepID=A0A2V2Z0X5_9BACL|nr:MFS transporter [Paenibacillus cellulosilyticus]PWW00886.1 FSR family fosmidomycin resistance protein-like MFS transporter [Paenibacillus cellulosilyticus]QKS47545.1 MFS transporter [Paenibacillus cellulosilyticus]
MSHAADAGRIRTIGTATIYSILFAISASHLLNDAMQAVVTALFPVIKDSLTLNDVQLGWIVFTLNMTSSVMQPLVGQFSDRRPMPFMLPVAMGLSFIGMIILAYAPSFWTLLGGVVLIGLGSAVFHPEGSRVVHFAAGGRKGLAQSIYQVGGNFGQMLAPLMTIFIFIPLGQHGAIWGTIIAAIAIVLLARVAPWYRTQLRTQGRPQRRGGGAADSTVSTIAPTKRMVAWALTLLVLIVFARSWYFSGVTTFYQFFAEDEYGLSKKAAQIPVFLYMAAGVIGTFFGGVLADKIGLKKMIVLSVAGAAPFALILPHLPQFWIYPVIFLTGLILQSGFSVTVVYAQQLLPGNIGMASGLITGLAFGMGAVGAVALGKLSLMMGRADMMTFASFLPLLGFLAFLLPRDRSKAGK